MSFSHYRGVQISLISKSDIRYEGILENIDPASSSIALTNVRSFGTEGRKGNPMEEVPASDNVFNYICFRASDVKDLVVQNEAPAPAPPPRAPAFQDPAIVSYDNSDFMSGPTPVYPQQTAPPAQGQARPPSGPPQRSESPPPAARPAQTWSNVAAQHGNERQRSPSPNQPNAKSPTRTPAAGYDGRRQQHDDQGSRGGQYGSVRGRGGRNGQPHRQNNGARGGLPIPREAFDFESANAKFHKEDLVEEFKKLQVNAATTEQQNDSAQVFIPPKADKAYDRKTSFFDDISCDTKERMEQAERGFDHQARRTRMHEERNLNVETFGASSVDQGRYRGRGGYRGGRGGNYRGARGGGSNNAGGGSQSRGRGGGGQRYGYRGGEQQQQ
ncbi:hypothetical protein RI367_002889 [Sorochytrium milnesiophthora]